MSARIGVASAVGIDDVGEALAVRRKIARIRFPLRIGGPGDLLCCQIKKSDIRESARAIGTNKESVAIGRDGRDERAALAFVRCEILGGAECHIDAIHIRIGKVRIRS